MNGLSKITSADNEHRCIVLLVDDQAIIAEAIRRMLEPEVDIEFHSCTESDKAMTAALEVKPTVILQDLVMPDIDGMSLLEQYRKTKELEDVPVIILSTKEDPQDKSDAFSAGASDYLVKVPDKVELIARIRAHSRGYLNQKQRDELLEQLQEVKSELERSNDELQKLSCMDGLTGIANRRHFDSYLSQEWLRALREKSQTSLILIDIDFFKPFNDNYGHQAGDDCLQKVAAALGGILQRPGDMAARYGGEEFVLILPYTDENGAQKLAEELLQTIEQLNIKHAHSDAADHITISLGVATLIPSEDLEPAYLIEMADKALYRAKEEGRNRFVMSPQKGKSDDKKTGPKKTKTKKKTSKAKAK